jgi:ring-1,2-phenylacetyl-CoA epoxidase subunit PaaC
MNDDLRAALAEYLLTFADDEMVLGHRDSEWTGHAPILEEDIAFANLALDEMGHASLWYRLHAELLGEDPESLPDRLVFHRPASGFLNAPLVELPRGDWAFSMLRQFLFDAAERAWLEGLARSRHAPLAAVARKIQTEERYHDRHTRAWVLRLGLGTQESRARMQRALDALWPYAVELFEARPGEALAASSDVAPESADVRALWLADVVQQLDKATLEPPSETSPTGYGRDRHTPHLAELVAEMQSVAQLEPEGSW